MAGRPLLHSHNAGGSRHVLHVPPTPPRRPRTAPSYAEIIHRMPRDPELEDKHALTANLTKLRGPPSLALRVASRRRAQPPSLPPGLRKWGGIKHGDEVANTLAQYRPRLQPDRLENEWHAAYAASQGRLRPATHATDSLSRPQLCAPSAIISRHLQSTLRHGFSEPRLARHPSASGT